MEKYFDGDFLYCEFYTPENCCKKTPCQYSDKVWLSKNHDYHSCVPILPGVNYLIQYRSFLPAVISDYELYARNKAQDNQDLFRKYATNRKGHYLDFMTRWSEAVADDSSFVRISYERMTAEPLDVFSRLVKQFRPDLPVDADRLKTIVAGLNRVSFEQGRQILEEKSGVAAFRDIRDFRYYDETFFAALEDETVKAYRTMEELPMVVSPEDTVRRSNSRARRTNKIVVDASGHLQNEGNVPTGIPRVQNFIVEQALRDADPDVEVVYYDISVKGFVPWNDRRKRKTSYKTKDKLPNSEHRSIWASALAQIAGNPLLANSFDRNIATRLVNAIEKEKRPNGNLGSLEKKLYYLYFKNTIRVRRRSSRILQKLFDTKPGTQAVRKHIEGCFLISHLAFSRSFSPHYINASSSTAFIFHDDIPLMYPKFLSSHATSERVRPIMKRLRHQSAIALCSSRHAMEGLQRFDEKNGTNDRPAEFFKMPSSLYMQAIRKGRERRIEPPDPFILYCSTIEVRKNHLLLAKVWKTAMEEGHRLPRLICVGKWGWGVSELDTFLNANPEVSEQIEFTGAISDDALIDLYRSAMFSVYPSVLEGWGLGASESLDFGLPVVTSTAESLQEATRGLMPSLDPHDVNQWLQMIRKLSENPKELQALREKIIENYRPVTEEESWQGIKAAIRKHYMSGAVETDIRKGNSNPRGALAL